MKSIVVLIFGITLPCSVDADESKLDADRELIREVGISTSPLELKRFLEKRILGEAQEKEIRQLIDQLGARRYSEREKAMTALLRWGEPARAMLKSAIADSDLEVSRRASRCLEAIDQTYGPSLTQAVIRVLTATFGHESVELFIRLLPFTEHEQVREEIRNSILTLGPENESSKKLLHKSLSHSSPLVQAVAASVLGRLKESALQEAVRKLLDSDHQEVRFRAAESLVHGEDASAMRTLIGLIEEFPEDQLWRVEDILYRLAGDTAPTLTANNDRKKYRKEWESWWGKHGPTIKLASLNEPRKYLGHTLGIEYNTGRVWECTKGGRLLWQIHVKGAMDAMILPGRKVLIAAREGVTIRKLDGSVEKWIQKGGSPNSCKQLKNGNIFVSSYSRATEYSPDGKQVYSLSYSRGGSNAPRKYLNGNIVYTTGSKIREVTTAGKLVREIQLPGNGRISYVGLHVKRANRFLVANSANGDVLEVDEKGKVHWKANVNGACGIFGMENGNVLVGVSGRVVELNRAGNIVWKHNREGYVRRVYRR